MAFEDGDVAIGDRVYPIVTLDFETFWDKTYTLSGRMNMSEYIRDDRFHAHGIGLKIGNEKAQWFTGKNIRRALEQIDWKTHAMMAHNTPFDGFICSHHFGIKPAIYLDTLSMARGAHSHHMRHDLNTIALEHGLQGKVKRDALADTKGKLLLTGEECAKLGGYCLDDTEDTYKIFWKLFPFIPDAELQLIDLTVRMFCDPVLRMDIPRVQQEMEREIGGKVAALLQCGATAEELMSNDKLAKRLIALGMVPPQKTSPSTGKPTYAFAKSDVLFQKLLSHSNPKIVALANARLKVKSTIGETRAARFLEAGKDGMAVPILLNYSGAHTHRWSGGNKLNFQNLKRGGELRKSILAPKGQRIVVADSAQIEARVLAWLAGQNDLLHAFANKQDPYKLMAAAIFGVPFHEVTKHQRFIGKVCVLGLGFGMGHVKLMTTLAQGTMGEAPVHLSPSECQRIVNVYRGRNSYIKELWGRMDEVLGHMILGNTGNLGPLNYGKGFIQLPNDLFLQYFGLRGDVRRVRDQLLVQDATYLTRTGRAKIYGGLLTENVVQALARCIVADQMLEISKRYRVVLMTHDEIVTVCPEKKADQCLADMIKVMSTPPAWAKGLPLAAEGGHDVNYSK